MVDRSNGVKAALIEPTDPRWKAALRRVPHDVYHFPGYVSTAAQEEGAEPAAIYAEDEHTVFLAPLLLRRLPEELDAPTGWRDASTPYGYATPILSPTDSGSNVSRFLEAFRRAAARQEIVAAFLRLHPLMSLPEQPLGDFGRVVRHGSTVYVDLTRPLEEIWSQTRSNHRRDINQLERAGYVGTMDSWEHYPRFIDIYRATMARVGAADSYFFSDTYFERLKEELGANLHLATVLSADGDVAGAGLFTECNGIVQYHLGGTAEEYYSEAPSKLMFAHVWRWGKAEGHSVLHLGGGVGGRNDSLFRFKAGFSDLEADYFTHRMIVDEQRYARLVDVRRRLKPHEDEEEFFPAYRA